MLEGLREFGLPVLRRMNEADDIAARLAPMGVFSWWVEQFGLPQSAVEPAFELTCSWPRILERSRKTTWKEFLNRPSLLAHRAFPTTDRLP